MERDRGAILTVRAAARRGLDFSKRDPTSHNWWRYANAITREMAREQELTIVRAAFDFQLALISNGGLTAESFDNAKERARDAFQDLINAVQPWSAMTKEELKSKGVEGLLQAYKDEFGITDLDDPVFLKKIEDGIETWKKSKRFRVHEESDEERIDRLIAERGPKGRRSR